jgi:hypothetical protein
MGLIEKGKSALVFQPNEIVETIFSDSESEQNSKKSNKKGPKSKKDVISDSEEFDFDIFANISPICKAKKTTKTPTTSATSTMASKKNTTKKVASKETVTQAINKTKATTSKETVTQAINKTKTNSKPNAKNSGFAPRK